MAIVMMMAMIIVMEIVMMIVIALAMAMAIVMMLMVTVIAIVMLMAIVMMMAMADLEWTDGVGEEVGAHHRLVEVEVLRHPIGRLTRPRHEVDGHKHQQHALGLACRMGWHRSSESRTTNSHSYLHSHHTCHLSQPPT